MVYTRTLAPVEKWQSSIKTDSSRPVRFSQLTFVWTTLISNQLYHETNYREYNRCYGWGPHFVCVVILPCVSLSHSLFSSLCSLPICIPAQQRVYSQAGAGRTLQEEEVTLSLCASVLCSSVEKMFFNCIV